MNSASDSNQNALLATGKDMMGIVRLTIADL